MKDCLAFIIKSILGTKETQINSEETQAGQVILTIDPKEEQQIGTIIGKKGKIINAIRKLLRVRAIKEGKKVLIKIKTPLGGQKGEDLPSEEVGGEGIGDSRNLS